MPWVYRGLVSRSVATGIRKWWARPQEWIEERKLALVVSSDPETARIAATMAPPEWIVLAAGDLADAIEILGSQEIAIAIVDHDSPSWRFVAARLAAAPYRCSVILLSSAATPNLWHELTRLGGYEIVAKPIRRDRLADVINAAWSHWRSQQALFTR